MTRLMGLPLMLALLGCTTDNYSVILLRNIAPIEGEDSCVVEADENALGILFGVLDVTSPLPDGALNPGYIFRPVALNGTSGTSPTQPTVGNPNSQIFFVQGAEIELVAGVTTGSQEIIDFLAGRGLTRRTHRFSTSIPPNGVAGLSFQAIDSEQTLAINEALGQSAVQVLARVQVFGEIDDDSIRTPVFEYPITLCRGCIVRVISDCSLVPPDFEGGISSCNPVQDDGEYDCCLSGGEVFCPAPIPSDE